MAKSSKEKLNVEAEKPQEKEEKKTRSEARRKAEEAREWLIKFDEKQVNEIYSHLVFWEGLTKRRLTRIEAKSKDKKKIEDARLYHDSISDALVNFEDEGRCWGMDWIASLPTKRELELERRAKAMGILGKDYGFPSSRIKGTPEEIREKTKILEGIGGEKKRRERWLGFLRTGPAELTSDGVKRVIEERRAKMRTQKIERETVIEGLKEAEEKLNQIFSAQKEKESGN